LRQVRRSERFQSRIRTQSRQRQEYAASVISTAVVQGALAISLWVAALRAYQAVTAQSDSIGILIRMAMPLVFFLGGLWCARLCLRNVRSGRELWTMARERREKQLESSED
jgi:hypothetical protein